MQNELIVGKQSPEFLAEAVVDGQVVKINSLDFYGSYVLFFFYESDFSFVCPTEMHALQAALPEFAKRNVKIIGVSVDSVQTHLAWLAVPRDKGGIQGITFTLLSDVTRKLSRAYGVYDEVNGVSLRGTFFADKLGIVQYGAVNSLSVGRNIDELLRVIDAIQFTEKYGELCPIDWQLGDPAIGADDKSREAFYKNEKKQS